MDGISKSANFSRTHSTIDARMAGIASSLFMERPVTLANESDLVGIAEIDPNWIYEGYEIQEPRVIIIGVEMDYAELAEAPSSFENPRAAVVVAKEYNRAARACRKLRNFIQSKRYFDKAFQGRYAPSLNFQIISAQSRATA